MVESQKSDLRTEPQDLSYAATLLSHTDRQLFTFELRVGTETSAFDGTQVKEKH